MKNRLEDVRNHLLTAMESLNFGTDDETKKKLDPEQQRLAVERAKAMSDLGGTYIQSVKVELDALRLADEIGKIPACVPQPVEVRPVLPQPGTSGARTLHRTPAGTLGGGTKAAS